MPLTGPPTLNPFYIRQMDTIQASSEHLIGISCLLHGRYKIYIMIPIDLETFQMLHPSFYGKKGKKVKGSS